MIDKLILILFSAFSFLLFNKVKEREKAEESILEEKRNVCTALLATTLAFLVLSFLLESVVSMTKIFPLAVEGSFIGGILFLVEKGRRLNKRP